MRLQIRLCENYLTFSHRFLVPWFLFRGKIKILDFCKNGLLLQGAGVVPEQGPAVQGEQG